MDSFFSDVQLHFTIDLLFSETLLLTFLFAKNSKVNLVLLSLPEGDEKPLKYPLMFEAATAVAVTKTDVAPAFDFSRERAVENIRRRNPSAPVFFTSGRTGEGIDVLAEYLCREIEKVKNA